ncbi:MAG: RluA family pseudouridine synthase [Candidatus Brocadiia bacterium]
MKPIHVDYSHLDPLSITIKKSSLEDYRLDVYLTKRLQEYSRNLIQSLIKKKLITINKRPAKSSHHLNNGDIIDIQLPKLIEPQMKAEKIPLSIIYEDEEMLAINKPPNMVVHPSAGHWEGTLVNALLNHCGVLPEVTRRAGFSDPNIYRPGIVHRLDKDTSGIIIAAKTVQAHFRISSQFEKRTIQKEYLALVEGNINFDSDIIEKPLGRDTKDYKKIVVKKKGEGREALSYYEVRERLISSDKQSFTLVSVFPKTGRTHQIRVHLASIKHPIVCDITYGGKKELTVEGKILLKRQALHAHRITLEHPISRKQMTFTAPLADDISQALKTIKSSR